MLALAKPTSTTLPATPKPIARRPIGPARRPRRTMIRRIRRRRIGISIRRYDNSVTATVAAMAMPNWRTSSGLPATPRIIW